MPNKIILSSNLQKRIEALEKILTEEGIKNPHPDLFLIRDEEKLGVEKTREIRTFLSTKPFQSDKKTLIIESAENLTVDAQNSLLKILEEPPGESIILLGANSEQSLLPTILSRCQIEYLPNTDIGSLKYAQRIIDLETKSMEERFVFIEKLVNREEFLDEMLKFYRLRIHHDLSFRGWVKDLLIAEEYQKSRVNIRLILEYLMLKLPLDKQPKVK